ncbi:hypothetical protein F5050DRAFT_1811350 [Lentinula boryana]|uniref:Uncharacterized protein n=1 Tax=Lentinula boryana TaxID=40481 RepID=A0ABQ8Q1N5_9AGAR|nr:hypothetical protein F5050DRAFT_1811350 [Lentinula boryana]
MCTKSPANAKRSRSQTPDQSLRYELFRRSPPAPSRTYGKNSRSRLRPNASRHAASMRTPSRHHSPPIASSSASPNHYAPSLAHESIILPATPSYPANPTRFPLDANLDMHTPHASKSPTPKAHCTSMEDDDDDEPVFLSMRLPVGPEPSCMVELDGLTQQGLSELRNALQDANGRIKALEEAAAERNMCGCCLDIMLQPFMEPVPLPAHHSSGHFHSDPARCLSHFPTEMGLILLPPMPPYLPHFPLLSLMSSQGVGIVLPGSMISGGVPI